MVARVQGRVIGWWVSRLRLDDDGIQVTDQLSLGEFAQQRTEILLDREGRLRRLQLGGSITGVQIRASLEYRRNRVRGVSVEGTTVVETDTLLPPGAIDDNAIALFLPALPLASGARWTFPVFSGRNNELRQVTLTVLGAASVSIPSGAVDTWEIELAGGESPLRYYVTQSSPHRLVRMDLLSVGISFLIVN